MGAGHRAPPGRCEGVGQVAHPLDGGADVRVAGQVPAADQGPGEEREVVGGVHHVGHDPPHAQPTRTQTCRGRVPISSRRVTTTYGTVTEILFARRESSALEYFEHHDSHPGVRTMTRFARWPVATVSLGIGAIAGLFAQQELLGQPPAIAPVLVANPPPLPRDWMSVAPVVKQVLPAVVCIEGQGRANVPKFEDFDAGFGSGVLIDSTGVVLTNHHVVAETDSVEVTLQDGRKFISKDIRRDPKTDLAVVMIAAKEPLPFAVFANSDAMEAGDRVLAIGAPFGLKGSVTQGIVSAVGRRDLNLNLAEDFLQIDAAVNSGNSGGALVNMEGKLIGLTAAIKTRTGGFQGVGLAVSSNLAKPVAEQLVQFKAVRRPYLGVAVREMDDATATRNKLKPGTGVLVTGVTAKSPAAKAHIGVGDVITTVNAVPIFSSNDLQKATLGLPLAKAAEVIVVRNGQQFQTFAQAEEKLDEYVPPQRVEARPAQTIDFKSVGLSVTELLPQVATGLRMPAATRGVVVTNVVRSGLAERSGLVRGAVITRVDDAAVASVDEFTQAVSRANRDKGAVLHVLRPNGETDFVILRGQ